MGSVFPVASFSVDDIKNPPYNQWADEDGDEATNIWQAMKDTSIDPNDGVSEWIQDSFGIAYDAEDEQRGTFYIKEVINAVLSIIWLVALAVLLFGFYKMFAARENEEAFKDARKYVIWATIALLVIGVSRFIVSWFFEIFFQVKEWVVNNPE